jgi:hypothetical protein
VETKRHQVFVSSTFLDLQEERAAVVLALLQMEAFPAGMELFPAADDDAWTLIQRVIESSDYYLLVVGGKYGSIDPATEVSFTEKEYDYAVERGKPVLAFLHADPDKIEFGKSEKDKAAQQQLEAFREKVKAKKHVKYWSGPDDLAGKVALSFANFRQTYPAVGWVRGDLATSAEALGELNELRKQLADAEAQTERARSDAPEEAKSLAQGDELVDFSFVARTDLRRASESKWDSTEFAEYLDAKVTWNDLFSCVGPEMLNEATERSLRERIHAWLIQEFRGKVITEVRRQVAAEDEVVAKINSVRITVSDEDFGTLIVQLRALGLIEKSERNRSVKDTKTYWSLTPYGDNHLTTLRAIRRDLEPTEKELSNAKPKAPTKRDSEKRKRKPSSAKGKKRAKAS